MLAMSEIFDIWTFLAGLGTFLLGLFFIENGLHHLVGRTFKKWLRTQTTHPIKGILGGTLITMLLQSSSVVSLMALAFVGAGILPLKNAIGVLFGTNLGTTFTGWIVASLGFEVEIAEFAMPLLALGGMAFTFSKPGSHLYEVGRLLLGFGFLFVGLDWMKGSIEGWAQSFDMTPYRALSPYWLFLVGFVLTAIIQSSSAAMVITLSSLYAGVISLEAAAAMVIGNDLGTTLTVIIGAIKGTPAKQQVAAAHFIFNLITDLIALLLLFPLLWLITEVLGISYPLYILVAFHSLFNFLGILLLSPFIPLLSRLLEHRFSQEKSLTQFISKVPPSVPDAAIEALYKEILLFTEMVLLLHVHGLNIRKGLFSKGRDLFETPYEAHYDLVKQTEGELVAYYLQVQHQTMEVDDTDTINKTIQALHKLMQSAKSIKDIVHNVKAFETSSNDVKLALYKYLKGQLHELYLSIYHLLQNTFKETDLLEFEAQNHQIFQKFQQELYRQIQAQELSELEISTLLNVNQEIFHANQAFLNGLKELEQPTEMEPPITA